MDSQPVRRSSAGSPLHRSRRRLRPPASAYLAVKMKNVEGNSRLGAVYCPKQEALKQPRWPFLTGGHRFSPGGRPNPAPGRSYVEETRP